MRVVHWYPNYFCGGGVAHAVRGLASAQARSGASVAIAAAEFTGRTLYEPMGGEDRVTVLQWQPAFTFRSGRHALRRLPQHAVPGLRGFDPDIVHVHGEFNPDNLWVPYVFRCPIVLSPHGGFRQTPERGSRKMLRALYCLIAKAVLYRHVEAVHALSPVECRYVHSVLPGTRVYLLPQGPNVRVRVPEPSREPTIQPGTVHFLFVGRLDVYTKGLDILLEAFADVHSRCGGQVSLTLVGPDWNRGKEQLQARGEELRISDAITFSGPLPGYEVALALRRADVYIQLSRYDTFPLTVSEALIAGKPAILSDGIGSASYAEVSGLPHVKVIPPRAKDAADAMIEFVGRLDELRSAARTSRSRVAEFFSWERVAMLQLQMYERILAGR